MRHFVKSFVVPLLVKRRWGRVCEIGASLGGTTQLLAALPHLAITVIDPCFDCDLSKQFAGNSRVTVKKGTSLQVLPDLREAFDYILIDGDHNWYTVYHELKLISDRNLIERGGTIFFHDVEWPYGRRDMYYQPESIPMEYRHDCARKGIMEGQNELSNHTDVNAGLWNATHEGGARNGVLTAIEDFLREHQGEYDFFRIRGNYGLGVMYRRKSFTEDLKFSVLKCQGIAGNMVGGLKKFVKTHFPSAFSLAKSLFGRARIEVNNRS